MNRFFKELCAKGFKAFCSVFAREPPSVEEYMVAVLMSWGRKE